jgi:hypothetical protein
VQPGPEFLAYEAKLLGRGARFGCSIGCSFNQQFSLISEKFLVRNSEWGLPMLERKKAAAPFLCMHMGVAHQREQWSSTSNSIGSARNSC